MQLIGSYTSPFVRKIRIQLAEKDIPYSFLEDVPWNTDSNAPKFNPLGKVPILIDEHGQVWFDSPVISEYLETFHTRVRLLPLDALQAVKVKQWEALADGMMEAGVAIFLERKRETEKQNTDWIHRHEKKLERSFAYLEPRVKDARWLHGDNLTLADIALICALDWLELRLPTLAWRQQWPHLEEYYHPFSDRAAFSETLPPSG